MLKTTAEKARYTRDHDYKTRAQCCHPTPAKEELETAVLWRHQHPEDKYPGGDERCCERCPFCILLPCLSKLYQLSSHLTLLQVDTPKKKADKKDKDKLKQEEFAKIAFPDSVLKVLPGESHHRCDEMIVTTQHHFKLSGKMERLDTLLKTIEREKGRVLLFSSSTRTLDIIERYMKSELHSYLRIDGSTPSKERQPLVNTFQKGEHFCFLLSTRAAGVGVSCVKASREFGFWAYSI